MYIVLDISQQAPSIRNAFTLCTTFKCYSMPLIQSIIISSTITSTVIVLCTQIYILFGIFDIIASFDGKKLKRLYVFISFIIITIKIRIYY